MKVDDIGNLTVAGAGVTSGTQVQLVDATDTTLKARLTAAGALVVDVSDTAFSVNNFPAEYALPLSQVSDLKVVDVTDRTGRVLGQVAITNWPADYPLPAGQVTTLTPQKDALTDTQLRATPVTVDTGLNATVSTEATLEAVRVQVAAVNANTDNVEALLDGQSALLGRDFTQAHQAGLNFVGGERLNFGGALSTARYVAAIRNPGTNTKIAYVYAVVLYTDTTQWFRWAVNPTLSAPSAVEAPRSLNLANPGTPTMEMWADTTVPTTADFWSPETRVTANGGVPLSFPRPVAIAPNTTFAVIGESSAAQQTCANVYFYEKAI